MRAINPAFPCLLIGKAQEVSKTRHAPQIFFFFLFIHVASQGKTSVPATALGTVQRTVANQIQATSLKLLSLSKGKFARKSVHGNKKD